MNPQTGDERRKDLRRQLHEYCGRDTEALVSGAVPGERRCPLIPQTAPSTPMGSAQDHPSARSHGLKPSDSRMNSASAAMRSVAYRAARPQGIGRCIRYRLLAGEKNETFWRWQSGAKLDIQSLELTDALTLRLIETSLRPLLPASVLKALEPRLQNPAEKLDAVNPRMPSAAGQTRSPASCPWCL